MTSRVNRKFQLQQYGKYMTRINDSVPFKTRFLISTTSFLYNESMEAIELMLFMIGQLQLRLISITFENLQQDYPLQSIFLGSCICNIYMLQAAFCPALPVREACKR